MARNVIPFSQINLGGGLNSASGSFKVADNEATDITNINFNKFGSIAKRNGYYFLNTSIIGTSTGLGTGNPEGEPFGVSMPNIVLTYIVITPTSYEEQVEMPEVLLEYTRSVT